MPPLPLPFSNARDDLLSEEILRQIPSPFDPTTRSHGPLPRPYVKPRRPRGVLQALRDIFPH